MSSAECRKFIISTDSTADLPDDYIRSHNLFIHPLYYNVDDVMYGGEDNNIPLSTFYDMMRNDSMPTTAASSPEFIESAFTRQVEEGYDVLHLSFSSGLSCSHNNAVITAREVMENHPGSRIEVVDTLAASMGQGLLVYYAVKMKEEGKSMDEIIKWVEENKLHLCHYFTVEDLKYLQRGGRISKTVAILGTLINVKPVLHVDDEGHLVPLGNVRGRKKSLIALVDNMEKQLQGYDNPIIFISHGDSLEDAEFVKNLITERLGITNFMISYVSPTIGSHSGPGTIALFHLGQKR